MKVLANETKRILAVLLSVAMIFAYVPSTVSAYADEVSGNDTEEAAVTEEDAEAPAEEAGEPQAPEQFGGTEDEVVDEELDARADIDILFDATTDADTLNAGIYAYNDSTKSTPLNETQVGADSEKAYVIMVEPDAGLAFDLDKKKKEMIITEASYIDFSESDTGITKTLDVTKFVEEDPTALEEGYNRGTKKVTIPEGMLAPVLAGKKANQPTSGILTLKFGHPATAAKWSISGFDLKDVKELVDEEGKPAYLPGKIEMTNGIDFKLKLADVLDVGSLNLSDFDVRVVVFDKDGEEVKNTGKLTNTAIDVDVSADAFSSWKKDGSKVWANYGKDNPGELIIDGDAISYCYNKGYSFVIDVTAAGIGTVKAKTNKASEKMVTFAALTDGELTTLKSTDPDAVTGLLSSTEGNEVSVAQNKNLYFKVTKKSDYDYLHSVTWTVDGVADDDYSFDIPAGQTSATVKIPASSFADGDVEVTATSAFRLTQVGTAYSVQDIDGNIISQAEADKTLNFQIAPDTGKKVASTLSYTMGGVDGEIQQNTNGSFTSPKITGAIEINAGISSAGDTVYTVKTEGNYDTADGHGVDVKLVDKDQTAINKTTPGSVAAGQPFMFTVAPKTGSDAVIEEVTYSMGTTKNAAATNVYGTTYKVPVNVTGNVTIKVTYQGTVTVHAPSNENVIVDFAEPGETVDAPVGGSFSFTARPAKSNVKITSIWYNTNEESKDPPAVELAGKDGGTFKLTAETYIYVETDETLTKDDFRAIYSTNANPNLDKVEKEYESGKPKTDINLKDQTLKLVIDDAETTVTGTYRPVKDGKIRTALGNAGLYCTSPETSEIITFKDADDTIGNNIVKITPKKVGNETLTVDYRQADAENTGNTLVYPGKLNVSVTQAYTDLTIAGVDTAYISTGDPTDDDQHIIKMTVKGKNGQTGEYENVAVGAAKEVTEIAWSFVPSIEKKKAADRKFAYVNPSAPKAVTDASSSAGVTSGTDNKAWVAANTEQDVTVMATVTFSNGQKETIRKNLTFIEDDGEVYFMTRSLTGAVDSFELLDAATATPPTEYKDSNPIGLGLNAADLKNVNIKYDIYHVLSSTVTVKDDCTTAKDIKELEEKGKIEKVTDAEIGTPELKNMLKAGPSWDKKNTEEYVTLATSDGAYKITGNKSTGTDYYVQFVAPDVEIYGVKLPALNTAAYRDVTFTVANTVPRSKVELITIDDQTEVNGSKVNAVKTLNTGYINQRGYSKVNDVFNGATKQVGIEFTSIADNVAFKLPEESDFVEKPEAKKTLLGWAELDYANGDIDATLNVADNVVAPGTYVTITDDCGYKAIWIDKYVKYTGTVGDASGQVIRLYDTTKSYVDTDKKTVYPKEVPASIEKGYNIPVVVGVGHVDSFDAGAVVTETDGDGNEVFKNIDLSKINVKEEFYTGDFTLEGANADAKFNLDSASLTNKTIKPVTNAKVGSAAVNVAWTDKKGNTSEDIYEQEVTLAVAADVTATIAWAGDFSPSIVSDKATLEASGVPAKLTGALTDDGKAITLIDEDDTESSTAAAADVLFSTYEYRWTSDKPAIATVEKGEKEDQDDVIITPLAQGTANIKLEVLRSGKVIAEKDFDLTVKESDIAFVFADETGRTGITEVLAHAGDNGTINAAKLKVKATTKAGKVISGGTYTFGAATDYAKNKVIDGTTQAGITPGAGDASGFTNLPIATNDFIGTDKLHVQFSVSISGETHTYQKDINVKTYYSVTLDPVATTTTWITINGEKQLAADGKSGKPVEIKLTETEMRDIEETEYSKADPKNKKNFNFKGIALDGYSAVYNDGTTPKAFSHWVVAPITSADPDDTGKIYDEDDTITKLVGYVDDKTGTHTVAAGAKTSFEEGKGTYTLVPVMVEDVTLTGLPGEITMDYDPTPGATNSKKVNINIAPKSYNNVLSVTGLFEGFYTVDDGATVATADQTTDAAGTGKASFTVYAYAGYDKDDKTTWNAGVDELTIAVPNSRRAAGVINLYVNGLDYDDFDQTVQYWENGDIVTSDFRTLNGNTYYFDANGNWIETTGITKINGKSVMIIDGVIAPKGKRVFEGHTYFVGDNGVIQTGWLTSDGSAATAANGVFYGDPAKDGQLVTGVQTIDGKTYYFAEDCKKAVASATANEYQNVAGTDYYVNAAGEVAMNGLFKVDGKDRLFRENGKIVLHTDTDVVGGKITVGGITYVIADDDTAKRDDILYKPVVKWTPSKFDSKWKKTDALPKFTYTVTVTSKNTGKEQTTDGTAVEAKVVKTTSENGVEKITLAVEANLAGYFVDEEGKTPATVENTKNAKLEETYVFKNGSEEGKKEGDVSEDGEAESEPEVTENTTTWNLFYTTEPLKVEVPEGAKHNSSTGYVEGTGKWTTYFGIGPDGTVHYSGAAKDRKKAANAGNSLIVIPLYGTDDSGAEVQTGEFEYQLPVYYQKPSLKLTSTTGTVKVNGGDQTLKTQVTQKKSNGAYEPLNVDAEGAVKLENWKNTQPTFEVDESVITFTATAKGNGNVAVQLPTWSDKISLKYTVKESKKNVLTGSTKQLVFNLNDVTNTAEQEFTLFYNSGDLNSGDPVTVTLPNKWADAKIEGIENGELSAQTMTLKFADGATPKKGTYSVKFSTKDKAAFTLKVVVSNADLKKNAISLKYQSKIDLTTGQKGVVIPTLKGVNGPIEDVALDDASAAKFEVEYNEATNQIIVTPVEGQVTVGKNGNVTFKITAGGVPCETTIKNFQVAGKMPAVKVSSVKLPKTKVIAGTATGESNVLCTYKQGGKTFSTTPIEFSVNGGTKTTSEDTVVGEGWWKVDKANVYVQYDAETGRMHVHSIANAKGKGGTVKCEFKFAGQTKVKKANFKVAIDSNK